MQLMTLLIIINLSTTFVNSRLGQLPTKDSGRMMFAIDIHLVLGNQNSTKTQETRRALCCTSVGGCGESLCYLWAEKSELPRAKYKKTQQGRNGYAREVFNLPNFFLRLCFPNRYVIKSHK